MIEINENDLSIEVKETLSFEHGVQRIYDDFKENIEYDVENNAEEFSENIEAMKKFLDYELTKEDKIAILEKIKEDYEYEVYRSDCNVTLFDEDAIRNAISNFVEEKFDFVY